MAAPLERGGAHGAVIDHSLVEGGTLRKKLAVIVSATALLAATPVTQASADPSINPSCPSGYACFWPNKNYGGNRGKVSGNNANFRKLKNSARSCGNRGWEDCISSIMNNGKQCTVYFYSLRNYSKKSRWHSLSRRDAVPDFGKKPPTGFNDPRFDNSISSNKWCRS
ncbi:peptidase inhibitor family I36 protein [Streptomyces sp. KR80]|uniref:peptidase inhibitor family I36 protein n=1 Tax=Streptomyces sp. KR80 TaxID=3457426 RepID=UPI003FD13D1C